MAVLSVNGIYKSFKDKTVLEDITFSVNKNDKIAIIGDNGEGKTTLFKIITKQLLADKGNIYIDDKATMGYLSQEVIHNQENTLLQEMTLAFPKLTNLEKEIDKILQKVELYHKDEDIMLYSDLQEKYELNGGYEYKYQIQSLLNKFGFDSTYYNRQLKSFSGGEKTRASLVKLLLNNPSVLLLDEPTNHLDLIMIEWLEKYLKNYSGSVIIISHDQLFIDNLVNKIVEIENHKATIFSGNYTYYANEKTLRYQQQLKQYNIQEKEIKRYEMLIKKFKPKPTKTAFAQSLEKKLDKMEKIDKPKNNKRVIKARFNSDLEYRVIMMRVSNLTFGYDGHALTKPFSLDVYNNDKICIMGQNGCGKTTLINCLMSNKHLINGTVEKVRDFNFFYFDQGVEHLDLNKTIFDTIHDEFPLMDNTEIRNLLARFLFIEDDVFKLVRTLSGGEKIRVVFALLSLKNYQMLFLDEPTNHLDYSTKKVIAELLDDYPGTIIMVSHDRYFVNQVANKIIYIQDQDYIIEKGNYNTFIESHPIENNAFNLFIKKEQIDNTKKDVSQKTKAKSNKSEIKNLEKQITKKEEELAKLQNFIADNDGEYDWLEYKKVQDEIETIELELHDLLIKLEDLE